VRIYSTTGSKVRREDENKERTQVLDELCNGCRRHNEAKRKSSQTLEEGHEQQCGGGGSSPEGGVETKKAYADWVSSGRIDWVLQVQMHLVELFF